MYAIVSKWAHFTPKDIERYQIEQKDGLHLRSYQHIQNIIDTSEKYLDKLIEKF